MKTRNMSPKGFLAKCTSKAAISAQGFLAAHREYLLTGELSAVAKPILDKVDNGLLPTLAVQELTNAVYDHIMVLAENKVVVKESVSQSKPFEAMVVDSFGIIQKRMKEDGTIEELHKDFSLPQEAQRWIDRRLFEGASDWHGRIIHTTAFNKDHNTEIVKREDSIARVLKQPKGPVSRQSSKTTNAIGWGVKVHETVAKFSQG